MSVHDDDTRARDLVDPAQADWKFFLPGSALGRAVVLGSPCAAVLALARSCREVHALAPDADSARELRERAAKAGRTGVQVLGAVTAPLPFAAASVDLVVVSWPGLHADVPTTQRGRRALMTEVARVLRPGGVVAWLDGRARRTEAEPWSLARCRRALRHAGFAGRRGFLLHPSATAIDWIVPDDAPNVWAALLGERSRRRWPGARVVLALARRAGIVRRRAPAFLAVAARATGGALGPGTVEALLREHWAALHDGPAPRRIAIYALTPFNRAPNAKSYMFAFADGARRPFAYVKLARDGGTTAFLDTSHASLTALAADERVAELRGTFPTSVVLADVAGHRVNVERYLEGRDFDTLLRARRDDPAHDARRAQVVRWIETLHLRTRVVTKIGEEPVDALLRGPIATMRELFPGVDWLGRYLERLEDRLALLRGTPVPLVFFHNSLATKNVKVTRQGIAVIDWEQSAVLGLPLVDLQHFLATYWGGRRGTPYDVTTAALLADGDPLGFRAALGAYATALELSPELADVLLVESYLIRARMVTGYRDRVLTCCRHLAEREVGVA